MDKKNKVFFGKEARASLKVGIDTVFNSVAPTLSASGRNVVYNNWSEKPVITNDGVSIAREIHPQDPAEEQGAELIKQVCEKTNSEVGDGPQPLYAKVLTPDGFVKIGSLKVGDKICSTDGGFQSVLGIFPKGKKEIFIVKTIDGREVECSEDHLWTVITNGGVLKTLTVKQMIENGIYKTSKDGSKNHNYYLPVGKVEFNKKDLLIDPYLLGVLLGDGSLTGSGSIEISLGIKKEFVIDKIKLPDGLKLHIQYVDSKNYFRVKIQGKTKENKTIKDLISELGLLGVGSGTKFIPKQYLYSDLKSRKELLQGLSDTDGHINKRGLLEYSTISKQLYSDMLELLRSLGKVTNSYLHSRKLNEGSYSQKSIYRIAELKGYKYGNIISDIIPTGKKTEMMCIKVSNPNHLYVTNDYVFTHNTTTSVILAHAMIEKGMELMDTDPALSPMKLRKEITEATEKVVSILKSQATPVTTVEDLIKVATISIENPEFGKTVADTIFQAGDNGQVIVSEDTNDSLTVKRVEGYEFSQGYLSKYMVTNPYTMVSELRESYVLCTEVMLNLSNELLKIFDALNYKAKNDGINKSLFIVCDEIHPDVINFANIGNMNMIKKEENSHVFCTIVKKPMQANMIEDIAELVGAVAMTKDRGLIKVASEYLGRAEKIIVKADSTTIITDESAKVRVQTQIDKLKSQIEEAGDDEHLKSKLQDRIAKLSGGVFYLNIGGRTKQEAEYNKMKLDDAVAATKAARAEGIVAGGGSALFNLGALFTPVTNGDEVLKQACLAPFNQILKNSGDTSTQTPGTTPNWGYNALTQKFVDDVVAEGIIDPVKVTISALRNASSFAGLFLTTEVQIVPLPVENTPISQN